MFHVKRVKGVKREYLKKLLHGSDPSRVHHHLLANLSEKVYSSGNRDGMGSHHAIQKTSSEQNLCGRPFVDTIQSLAHLRAWFIKLLRHLFWHCNQTTRFWESFFKWLQTSLCTQKGNKLDMTIALGLKPDTSNAKLQINFSCLMSRYCIWVCKLKNEIPNLSHFLHLMNKSYEIEKNDPNSSSEKWKPLLGHLSN